MSQHANPNQAHVWFTGDAFRGLAGMDRPSMEDIFGRGDIPNMDAFGGIEAGFAEAVEQTVNRHPVWNRRRGTYKVSRDPASETITFRAVDNNKATVLTRSQGGRVWVEDGHWLLEKGMGEEFSFLAVLDDGEASTAYWSDRVTLSGPATRAGLDGQGLDGWEFPVTALEPFQEILPAQPEGMEEEDLDDGNGGDAGEPGND